jgi:hypothetical protein
LRRRGTKVLAWAFILYRQLALAIILLYGSGIMISCYWYLDLARRSSNLRLNSVFVRWLFDRSVNMLSLPT